MGDRGIARGYARTCMENSIGKEYSRWQGYRCLCVILPNKILEKGYIHIYRIDVTRYNLVKPALTGYLLKACI